MLTYRVNVRWWGAKGSSSSFCLHTLTLRFLLFSCSALNSVFSLTLIGLSEMKVLLYFWFYVYNDNIPSSPCDVYHAKEFFLCSAISSSLAAPLRGICHLASFRFITSLDLSLVCMWREKGEKEADSPSSTWQGDVAKPEDKPRGWLRDSLTEKE